MKRFAALLLLLCMALAAAPGLADDEWYAGMEVVDCSEWVSLRESPSTWSARLTKVPLGAVVSNCRRCGDGWFHAEYDGYSGYILAKYLQPCEDRPVFPVMIITITDEGAPFYAAIDADVPADFIPADTIVRNCCITDNNRIYVEWGDRCGYIRLMHAEVYNEMLHFPHSITLYSKPGAQASAAAPPALEATWAHDFPLDAYDYSEYAADAPADQDVPQAAFVLHSDAEIHHVHLFCAAMTSMDAETGTIAYEATLENIQYRVDPDHPLLVGAVIWGDTPNLIVGYEDPTGAYRFAFIEISGEDGRLLLREF